MMGRPFKGNETQRATDLWTGKKDRPVIWRVEDIFTESLPVKRLTRCESFF
jgi:hypothetical protein